MFGNDISVEETLNPNLDSKQSDMFTLTPEENDVIGEVGNISMGAAATVLHSLVQQEVQITTPKVSITTLREISKQFEKPCLLVEVEYLSGLKGLNLFVVSEKDAKIIANLMLGKEEGLDEGEVGDLELSAIGEAMNQMMGASATSMSTIFNKRIDISPPNVDFISFEDKIQKENRLSSDEKIVQTEFRMSVGDLIDSSIMVLADVTFVKGMVKQLIMEQQADIPDTSESRMEQKQSKEEPAARMETPVAAEEKREVVDSKPKVKAQPMMLEDFNQANNQKAKSNTRDIDFLQDIPLQVSVRLGCARMTIKDVLTLGKGSVVELDRLAGEDVDLLVNGKLVAKGEVVVIEENFAFRVKKIISPFERLKDL